MMKVQRIAVVTRANGGIGFAIARQLAQAGIRVIATSRATEKGREAGQKLRGQGDVTFETLAVDDYGEPASLLRVVMLPGACLLIEVASSRQ